LFVCLFFNTGFAKKCLISYEPTFGESFKRGKVVGINPTAKEVTIDSGEKVAYDELILATGTGGPFPAKLPLDVDKKKAIERYEEYVKLVSVVREFKHFNIRIKHKHERKHKHKPRRALRRIIGRPKAPIHEICRGAQP